MPGARQKQGHGTAKSFDLEIRERVTRSWQPVEKTARWGHRAYRERGFRAINAGGVSPRGVLMVFQQASRITTLLAGVAAGEMEMS